MKKFITSVLSVLILSLLLFSCQPGVADEPPATPKGRLLMHYVLDTLYGAGKDTAMKYSFTYNDKGRITSALMQEYDASAPAQVLLYWQLEKHIYNGAEELPSKNNQTGRERTHNILGQNEPYFERHEFQCRADG